MTPPDVLRAVALLEEYRRRLQPGPLHEVMGQVARLLGSALFNALVDIQEYYEVMLRDAQDVAERRRLQQQQQQQSPQSSERSEEDLSDVPGALAQITQPPAAPTRHCVSSRT
ncbi:unnamed protein product [Lampetra fluviatilis]